MGRPMCLNRIRCMVHLRIAAVFCDSDKAFKSMRKLILRFITNTYESDNNKVLDWQHIDYIHLGCKVS